MSEPFIAEIRIFGFNFAPKGWAFCNGQIMPISQNTALFSLLSTMYGGDGKTTFGLPNLQGSMPVNAGTSTTGTTYYQGDVGGAATVSLVYQEMPPHNHQLVGDTGAATLTTPVNNYAAGGTAFYKASPTLNQSLNPYSLTIVGNSLPHNNMVPYLTLNFCIALQGVFPARP